MVYISTADKFSKVILKQITSTGCSFYNNHLKIHVHCHWYMYVLELGNNVYFIYLLHLNASRVKGTHNTDRINFIQTTMHTLIFPWVSR